MASQNSSSQNSQSGFVPITQQSLSDPAVSLLNNELQRLWAAVQSLSTSSSSQSSGSTAASWVNYTPAPSVSGSGMTFSSFTTYWGETLNNGQQVFINLDLGFTISGSGTEIMITLPTGTPASNSYGNVFSCIIYQGSSTPIAGIARLGTTGSSAGILVYKASGGSFSSGVTEIVITGWYQINGAE